MNKRDRNLLRPPKWHGLVQPKDWHRNQSEIHRAWMVKRLRVWLFEQGIDATNLRDIDVVSRAQAIVDHNNAAALSETVP